MDASSTDNCLNIVQASQNLSAITTQREIDSSFGVIFVSNIVENIAEQADEVKESFTKSQEVSNSADCEIHSILSVWGWDLAKN